MVVVTAGCGYIPLYLSCHSYRGCVRVAVDCMRFKVRLVIGREDLFHVQPDDFSLHRGDIGAIFQKVGHIDIIVAESG